MRMKKLTVVNGSGVKEVRGAVGAKIGDGMRQTRL